MSHDPAARKGPHLLKALGVAAAFTTVLAASIYIQHQSSAESVRPARQAEASNSRGPCGLHDKLLRRIRRGYIAGRSEEIQFVLKGKNYLGAFDRIGHSGARDFLQRVPLVLYGSRIAPVGASSERATLADIYPTIEKVTGVELESRQGKPLVTALVGSPPSAPPPLIVTVVWDGVGRNVLTRWPEAWPTLKFLEQRGASYVTATLGSSPSITPATHSTLATGAFPRQHGVTSIRYRAKDGSMKEAFAHRDPRVLRLSTFADQIDRAFDNRSKVGLVAWRTWHIGMMGHGAAIRGGDKDQLALIELGRRITGPNRFFSTPAYLDRFPGFNKLAAELDAQDGIRDGRWRGHDIAADFDNPAWVAYQSKLVHTLIDRENYGQDEVPDFLFVNFKVSDIVGHKYSMDSPEMEEVLRAQDQALGRLVSKLDEQGRQYVLIVTADHGHTPSPQSSAAWPLVQRELWADVDRHFKITGTTLTESMSAVGMWVRQAVLRKHSVTRKEIARFVSRYTIRDNWARPTLPAGYRNRGSERIFEAVFPGGQMNRAIRCASRHSPSRKG